MPHELLVEIDGVLARKLRLENGRITVGRSSENDVSYPDDQVMSRRHLVITAPSSMGAGFPAAASSRAGIASGSAS
jgi:pSer/pThr/pTyr-binding forkhead associated (FHA) protein